MESKGHIRRKTNKAKYEFNLEASDSLKTFTIPGDVSLAQLVSEKCHAHGRVGNNSEALFSRLGYDISRLPCKGVTAVMVESGELSMSLQVGARVEGL